MPATFNPYLTAAGLAAAVTAAGMGLEASITHVTLGAGQYTPAVDGNGLATQTDLVDRREKRTFGTGIKLSPLQVTMSAVFPVYGGTPYNAGEVGFWIGDPDTTGVLFAVYSAPAYVHAFRNDQTELAESYSLTISKVPAGSVNVTVDPSAAGLEAAVAAHVADPNPHPYLIRTGDRKETYNAVADPGWLLMDDGTIGDATSGASSRANADCQALFTVLWDLPALLPVYTSAGASVARGVSAAADWAAHRRLQLPLTKGRSPMAAGQGSWKSEFTADTGTDEITVDANESLYTGSKVRVASTTTLPGGLAAATDYYAIKTGPTTYKLATSLANAHAGTAINITSAGSGTHTVTMLLSIRILGSVAGEETHVQTEDELVPHEHEIHHGNADTPPGGYFNGDNEDFGTYPSDKTGGGQPMNVTHPVTVVNYMIKL